ncbi:efflux RND transporter periplasmic adaptor subunit [bacterium]|nr:efflux RND transporter periplasmic adaptor subunit [bacterium]
MKNVMFLIFLFSLFCAGCAQNENHIVRPVETYRVHYETTEDEKVFSGVVSAEYNAGLAFKIEGEIESIYVSEGDNVKKGQTLAELDNSLYEIEELEASAKFNDAKIRYQNSENYYKRIDKLYAAGGVSKSNWEKAYTNMRSAFYEIESAKGRLEYYKKRAGYGKLKAPFDGTIIRKNLTVGDYVSKGAKVFDFQASNFPEIRLQIPQNYINDFYVGQVGVATFDFDENLKIEGKVKNLSPATVNSSGYNLKFILSKNDYRIKDGMSTFVSFPLAQSKKGALFIPLTSCLSDGRGVYVYKILKKKNEYLTSKTYIQTSLLKSGKIAITNGLSEGDIIALRGVSQIQNNMKVIPTGKPQ